MLHIKFNAKQAQHQNFVARETNGSGDFPAVEKSINLIFTCDTSGSMTTEKMAAVNISVNELYSKLIRGDEDMMAMYEFNSKVSEIFYLTPRKSINQKLLTLPSQGSGLTALYDATAASLRNLPPANPNVHVEVLVLTDGEDTSSHTANLSSIQKMLGDLDNRQNFAFTLIGVGIKAAKKELMKSMCVGKTSYYLECDECFKSITTTFNTFKDNTFSRIEQGSMSRTSTIEMNYQNNNCDVNSLGDVFRNISHAPIWSDMNQQPMTAQPQRNQGRLAPQHLPMRTPTAALAAPTNHYIPALAAPRSMSEKKKSEQCQHWPDCKFTDEGCWYVHPKKMCTKFPNCIPSIEACCYINPACPKSPNGCYIRGCVYQHQHLITNSGNSSARPRV